jgi:hypothetical protein
MTAAVAMLPPSCKKWKKWRVRDLWAHKEKGMWNGMHWAEVVNHEIDRLSRSFQVRFGIEELDFMSSAKLCIRTPECHGGQLRRESTGDCKIQTPFCHRNFLCSLELHAISIAEIKPNHHKTYRPARAPCSNSQILDINGGVNPFAIHRRNTQLAHFLTAFARSANASLRLNFASSITPRYRH